MLDNDLSVGVVKHITCQTEDEAVKAVHVQRSVICLVVLPWERVACWAICPDLELHGG